MPRCEINGTLFESKANEKAVRWLQPACCFRFRNASVVKREKCEFVTLMSGALICCGVCNSSYCPPSDSVGPGDPQELQAVSFCPRTFGARRLVHCHTQSAQHPVQGNQLSTLCFQSVYALELTGTVRHRISFRVAREDSQQHDIVQWQQIFNPQISISRCSLANS